MVEHIVLFKIKEDTSESEKLQIVEILNELSSIEGIVEMSAGLNHSQEGKSKGFEVGMRICFKDMASLDAYLPHPIHKSTIAKVKAHFADVMVFDYTH